MDNDPYEDKDLSSTRLPPLRKPYEREGPSVVNRSSTGVLLIDGEHFCGLPNVLVTFLVVGNHKVGTCSPVYTISIGSCLDTCHTDRNCPGKWKCCSNGCGRICSPPVRKLRQSTVFFWNVQLQFASVHGEVQSLSLSMDHWKQCYCKVRVTSLNMNRD